MPRLDNISPDMEGQTVQGSPFKFSTTKIEKLGATEYTVITLAVDRSGSVDAFKGELEKAIAAIVEACKYSPRADNLMLRLVSFADDSQEEHGFKLLGACNVADYQNLLRCGGGTALYDAAFSSVEVMRAEARRLNAVDYTCNGIVFVITDGEDNRSTVGPAEVKKSLAAALKDESLESLVSILIGVGSDPSTSTYLQRFKDEAGFTQYVNVGDATPKALAKLAQFVSRSISAQSQSLGKGAPAQSLTF